MIETILKEIQELENDEFIKEIINEEDTLQLFAINNRKTDAQ